MDKHKDQDKQLDLEHIFKLPDAPGELASRSVKAWRQDVQILTYEPAPPELNPMFLENRIYQGSSGSVYPMPFIDRIATEPHQKLWKSIHIENEYLRLMILPEIGGRIHIGFDKTTGYDFFYRQNVIKPALVGLGGPWISGGVEFNWPQHHRPATYMPVATEIEEGSDGSITVWCSDHDPMLRMKGMHGICLHPGRAILELKVRLFNRTAFTQTFLWWANAATRVHEKYQSFFPTDVRHVADHAKRAITSFPLCDGHYYGVNYKERASNGVPEDEAPRKFVPEGSYAANDLSWYANIPVPTSYMVAGTEQDFFGGYDHRAEAGVVHVANHHIAPGKKQWTWGNHEFGYAWDRNLTNNDGPYIELMAGVYTDNQPDFSYLVPWETKTFSQFWYPIHRIGIPKMANVDAAVSIWPDGNSVRIGLYVTRDFRSVSLQLKSRETEIGRWNNKATVAEPLIFLINLPESISVADLAVVVQADGRTLIEFNPAHVPPAKPPTVASEPAAPEDITSVEELYLTGVHLNQYRHATRRPEIYWQEGLKRDPEDSRTHNALGIWCLKRGELEQAAVHFEAAVHRLTHLNPNPSDGEPFYYLGLTRRYQEMESEAYKAFYKATWNAAWRGPAYFALAEIDTKNSRWEKALDHVQRSLSAESDNLNALNLLSTIIERLGDPLAAESVCRQTLSLDPLDVGARWQLQIAPANGQECLDLAFDLMRAGLYEDAEAVLCSADRSARDGSVPIVLIALSFNRTKFGSPQDESAFLKALDSSVDYCFPSRLEEMLLLEWARAQNPESGTLHYLYGNLLYAMRRHEDAIAAWEEAARYSPDSAIAWRNLAFAYFNIRGQKDEALEAFDRAFAARPADARILYERDQLWKRVGEKPERRLRELQSHRSLVSQRDDLSVEVASLLNQLGQPEDALNLLLNRKFQPWEGGEGLVLSQYVRARLLMGRLALQQGDPLTASIEFRGALELPESLGEAKHLLANQNDIYYWLGTAFHNLGDNEQATCWWKKATSKMGDFQQMSVRNVSVMTYWSALAHQRLGEYEKAFAVFNMILDYSLQLEATEPTIDYFATSLPSILLLSNDIKTQNLIEARFLRAQSLAGLGRVAEAVALLFQVLELDVNHTGATDLLDQNRASGNQGEAD